MPDIPGLFQADTEATLVLSHARQDHFESGKSFWIGDIEITPYLMDHSAFDAYAFIIKSNGKSLFYSGDFRIHGRKTKAFDWFCYNVEKEVDTNFENIVMIVRPSMAIDLERLKNLNGGTFTYSM